MSGDEPRDLVAEIEYPYTATDATNECMQLRKAKAEYVIYHGYSGAASYTAIFFKTAKKIMKDVQLMGTHYTTGRFPILVCGDAYDGYIGVNCRPMFDAYNELAWIALGFPDLILATWNTQSHTLNARSGIDICF